MKRPWLFGLAVGIVFALTYLSGVLDLPEARTLDLRFELRGPRTPVFPVVVVSADDDSLAEINLRWPWPRSYHAKVIEQIASGNPLAIGVDILFPEKSQDREDDLLAQAIARAKRVVLGSTLRTIATQTTVGVTQQREIAEPPIPTKKMRWASSTGNWVVLALVAVAIWSGRDAMTSLIPLGSTCATARGSNIMGPMGPLKIRPPPLRVKTNKLVPTTILIYAAKLLRIRGTRTRRGRPAARGIHPRVRRGRPRGGDGPHDRQRVCEARIHPQSPQGSGRADLHDPLG